MSTSSPDFWRCKNPFPLVCTVHSESIEVPCGRWRECIGCARRLGWKLQLRFLTGIETFSYPFAARFFTLTFPEDRAPDETEAQRSLRSLVRRLRYRGFLGDYGWVLERQKNGTLHFHGIAEMCHMADDLDLWVDLIEESGFGTQNSIEVARPSHAGYCARYISRKLADLAPLRRAYAFTPSFPRPPKPEPENKELNAAEETERGILHPDEVALLEKECDWISEMELHRLIHD